MLLVSALALFLFQDDTLSPSPVPPATSALAEMVHNSGPVAFTVLSSCSSPASSPGPSCSPSGPASARRRCRASASSAPSANPRRLSELASVADQFKPSPLVSVFNEIHDEYQRQTGGRGLPRNPIALERAAQTASSEALTAMESA